MTRSLLRWIALWLAMVVPVQLSWAAAAAYCGHESGMRASHFGHHEHRHHGMPVSQHDDDEGGLHSQTHKSVEPPSGIVDDDCAHCQAGISKLVPTAQMKLLECSQAAPREPEILAWAEHISDPLERPNWRVA